MASFGPMSISNNEFRLISTFVYENIGINLTEEKRNLVIGRLQKLVRSLGFGSFKHYYDYLSADRTGQALDRLVNRISTNYTYFHRESDHFDFFRSRALPDVVDGMNGQNCKDLRIWCAGCSSGEEPYMLVMQMFEYFGREYGMWDAGVLATDISGKALDTAKSGVYTEKAVGRVPSDIKQRYFIKNGPGELKISEKVKREVTFRRFNLMNRQFPFKKPFQMIFCRNVMIYFDQPTRVALIRKFYDNMVPGGYLFIGHSETLGRKQPLFDYVMPAVYRKKL
jgi:chemotaxis protein methyltransferase CheR